MSYTSTPAFKSCQYIFDKYVLRCKSDVASLYSCPGIQNHDDVVSAVMRHPDVTLMSKGLHSDAVLCAKSMK